MTEIAEYRSGWDTIIQHLGLVYKEFCEPCSRKVFYLYGEPLRYLIWQALWSHCHCWWDRWESMDGRMRERSGSRELGGKLLSLSLSLDWEWQRSGLEETNICLVDIVSDWIWAMKFPDDSAVKNPPAVQETQETWVGSVAWEHPLEEGHGNPLQYSCLENSTDRGAWWATVPRAAESVMTGSNWTEHTTQRWGVDRSSDMTWRASSK